jgi:hypothetical protein
VHWEEWLYGSNPTLASSNSLLKNRQKAQRVFPVGEIYAPTGAAIGGITWRSTWVMLGTACLRRAALDDKKGRRLQSTP